MTRLKLRRTDFWIYITASFVAGVILGNLFSFSSPSSEARFETLDGVESGFFESISNPADLMFVGAVPRSVPTFTDNTFRGEYAYAGLCSPRRLKVTAYCPCEKCCGDWATIYPRKTASGHKIQKGDRFVAAPPEYPFWTYLTIEGYAGGLAVPVLDRGGKIKGNTLDVFFGDHDEALAWGVREMRFD